MPRAGLLSVAFTATVAVPGSRALCDVVLGTAVPTGGPDAVGVTGVLTALIGHAFTSSKRPDGGESC